MDGMLCDEAGSQPDIIMLLCVSRIAFRDTAPRRYKRSACLPVFFKRRGLGRLLNLPVALWLITRLSRRKCRPERRVVLFVRNDPVYLFTASLLRGCVDRLVFQSSFPHEESSGWFLKRWIARAIYRLSSRGVDVVTGVSSEGVQRAQRLCPHAFKGPHIPLLSDLPIGRHAVPRVDKAVKENAPMSFIYVGTHRKGRELELVLSAIVRALSNGVAAHFRFIGACFDDEARLSKVPGVVTLIKRNVIRFDRPVPRAQLPDIMASADVGISLIPPKSVFHESSPTKIAEYMGAGLAVLANRGIPIQEQFVMQSNCGLLVDWNASAIAEGIQALCADPDAVSTYGKNAANFARQSLQYRSYLPKFRQLLGLS